MRTGSAIIAVAIIGPCGLKLSKSAIVFPLGDGVRQPRVVKDEQQA